MTDEVLRENILDIRRRIERAARGERVELLAATKTVAAETVNRAFALGVDCVGENRVQEAMQKFPSLNPQIRLHIIGQLQTNKVKYIMPMAAMVQSLDRDGLAQALDRHAREAGRVLPVLIEVAVGGEAQKGGVAVDELIPFVRRCAKLPGIRVRGLMAVVPIAANPEEARPYFRRMRTLFERLRAEAIEGVEMACLSMGMSNDYVVAVEEGATMVRLGSAIFGARTPKLKEDHPDGA